MYFYDMTTTILASGHLNLSTNECETCGFNTNDLEYREGCV